MDVILLVFFLALGLCVGSFLNVVIYRMPRGESIVFPPSHCPSCGRRIAWHDNIPILSWLVLRGRCRHCKTSISPRYLVVEAVTGLLVGGLFAWYFLGHMRLGMGSFWTSWPVYAAHAVLLCGLLVCSAVDIERWIVPLEVCWFVTVVGIVAMTAAPPSDRVLIRVQPTTGAMAYGALAGLAVALILVKRGVLQRSFLDADDKALTESAPPQPDKKPAKSAKPRRGKKGRKGRKKRTGQPAKSPPKPAPKPKITAVAATRTDTVNPRAEMMRELLFLAPVMLGAVLAWVVVTQVPSVAGAWRRWHGSVGSSLGRHLGGLEAALVGYLVGAAWIWGIRLFGTLLFGKEAMGLGDVHILGAVGACCGWLVPSVAFFLAPIFGLLWAIYLWMGRKQRELPYGPWLALASVAVLLFYDQVWEFLEPYRLLFR